MRGERTEGARRRHRGQHRGVVRGAGVVRFLRPGHGVRTRRAPEHTGQPHRGPAGPPRSPADGPRRGGIRCAVPRSARRHGGRRACRCWRTGRTASTSARPAMCWAPGTRLRDEFTAYVPSRPQLEWQIRRRVADIANVEIQHRSVAEPRFDADAAAGDRGVAGQRHRRSPIRRRRPRRRRGRTRHQAAGVAGAVGISAPARKDGRRGHWLCVASVSAARGRDPGEGDRCRRVPAAAARAGPAGLRGRHLDADHLRCRESRTAAYLSRDAGARQKAAAATDLHRAGTGRTRRRGWLSTASPPAGGAATTSWTAFRPGFFRWATPWPASTRRTGRA